MPNAALAFTADIGDLILAMDVCRCAWPFVSRGPDIAALPWPCPLYELFCELLQRCDSVARTLWQRG
jgi:hypothetical protein